MDDELRALQEQFAAVQMASATHRLSERNCVEIVLKLMEMKKVELIVCGSGKEYVTPRQLREEIDDEILAHGGRIGIVELQPLVNVDMSYVEDAAFRLVNSHKSTMMIVNGEILTQYYLDRMAQELNDKLQEHGQMSLSEVSKQYTLPIQTVTDSIIQRLDTHVFGVVKDGKVYTDTFVQRHLARVRGAFSALTIPTSLRSVYNRHSLMSDISGAEVDRLARDHALAGNIVGGRERGTFIPSVFSNHQSTAVVSFYEQNGYVEYSKLTRLQIGGPPQDYLQEKLPDGMALRECWISDNRVESVIASVEECVSMNTWMDIEPLLPPPLSDEDINMVLAKTLKSVNANAADSTVVGFCGRFAVAVSFVDGVFDSLKSWIKSQASNANMLDSVERADDNNDNNNNDDDDTSVSSASSGRKRKKRKKKGRGRNKGRGDDDDDDSDNDDYVAVVESPKKLSKKQQRKMKKKSSNNAAAQPLSTPKPSPLPSASVLEQHLREQFDALDDELYFPIAKFLLARVHQAINDVRVALRSGGASVRRKLHEQNASKLQDVFDRIQVFHHAIGTLDENVDRELSRALHRYLLKSVGLEALDILVLNEVMHASRTYDEISEEPVPALTWEDRKRAISGLTKDRSDPLNDLVAVMNEASCEPLVSILESVAAKLDVRIKSLDRKRERNVVFNMRYTLIEQLRKIEDHTSVWNYAVIILYSQVYGTMLHAPTVVLPQILPRLEGKVTPEVYKLLNDASAPAAEHALDEVEAIRKVGIEPKSALMKGVK